MLTVVATNLGFCIKPESCCSFLEGSQLYFAKCYLTLGLVTCASNEWNDIETSIQNQFHILQYMHKYLLHPPSHHVYSKYMVYHADIYIYIHIVIDESIIAMVWTRAIVFYQRSFQGMWIACLCHQNDVISTLHLLTTPEHPKHHGFSSLNLQWLKRRGDVAAWHVSSVAMPYFVKPWPHGLWFSWSYADLLELPASVFIGSNLELVPKSR